MIAGNTRPSRATFGVRVSTAIVVTTMGVLTGLGAVPAWADDLDNGGFEGFALGEPVGQFGWNVLDLGVYNASNFDLEIVDPSGVWGTALGTRALRVSNAVTSFGFGNQLTSFELADEAGETGAEDSIHSGGTRQSRFSGIITFASATQTYQPDLSLTISPDDGGGTRMSWFSFTDQPDGLQIDVTYLDRDAPAFVYETLASGLSRTEVHTLEFIIDFVDGETDDILWMRLGSTACRTWTASGTWEDYHRDYGGGSPHPVDSLLFRIAGDPAPGNAGGGFLFDTIALSSSTVPPIPPEDIPAAPPAPTVVAVGDQVTVTGTPVATNPCTPVTEYTITATPTGGGAPLTFTSPTPTYTFTAPFSGVFAVVVSATNSLGVSAASAPTDVTVPLADTGSRGNEALLGAWAAILTLLGAAAVMAGRRDSMRRTRPRI